MKLKARYVWPQWLRMATMLAMVALMGLGFESLPAWWARLTVTVAIIAICILPTATSAHED